MAGMWIEMVLQQWIRPQARFCERPFLSNGLRPTAFLVTGKPSYRQAGNRTDGH